MKYDRKVNLFQFRKSSKMCVNEMIHREIIGPRYYMRGHFDIPYQGM